MGVSDDLPVHIRLLAGDLRRRAVTLPRSTGNPARPRGWWCYVDNIAFDLAGAPSYAHG
jgi:hypothetical protein